jgi:methylphosphotriester-DNA--protein-cysteine methyltransferase
MPRTYQLRDATNREYESREPGAVGGHAGRKIYGRLDCPSALHWIAKGHYVKHRVFFRDERTAVAAGFRPCGCCMKEKYRRWKLEG